MRFRAHKFRGTLAARSGGTEGEDTGQRMRQGTQGVHCTLVCWAVPVVGSAGAEICDTFPFYSGTNWFPSWAAARVLRLGGLLPVLWEGKHSQVPVRSEACPCIISHNSIVPCSLVPAEHTPSEFVTTNINQFGPREVLTRGPDASEGRRTCRPQLEIDPRTSPVRHHRPLAGERITAAAQFRRGKGAPANSFSLRPPPREIEPAACARAPQQQQLSDWPRPLCLFVERYLIVRWQVCSALLL